MSEVKEDTFGDVREHSRAAVRAWGDSVKSLIPQGLLEKGREGNREALLAFRGLLDVAIDRLDPTEDRPKPRKKKKVKVEVE